MTSIIDTVTTQGRPWLSNTCLTKVLHPGIKESSLDWSAICTSSSILPADRSWSWSPGPLGALSTLMLQNDKITPALPNKWFSLQNKWFSSHFPSPRKIAHHFVDVVIGPWSLQATLEINEVPPRLPLPRPSASECPWCTCHWRYPWQEGKLRQALKDRLYTLVTSGHHDHNELCCSLTPVYIIFNFTLNKSTNRCKLWRFRLKPSLSTKP